MATAQVTDYSAYLQQASQRIIFYQEVSGKSVDFKAFDLAYSESINNDWDEEVLPRRINRAYAWAGVVRKISLAWSMPAFDIAEAKLNMQKCSLMVKMMYPQMEDSIITGGSPYWRLGVMNWAHAGIVPAAASTSDTLLAGFPNDFSFNIVASDGYLYEEGQQNPYPKHLKVSLSYTVILDDSYDFGWDKGWKGPKYFPWDEDPTA